MTDINFNDYAIQLSKGKHDFPEAGLCVMECVAYIAGEKHTDHPECADSLLTGLAIALNDVHMRDDQRQAAMLPFVLRLAGSKTDSLMLQQKRMDMLKQFLECHEPVAFCHKKEWLQSGPPGMVELYSRDVYVECFYKLVNRTSWGFSLGWSLLHELLKLTDEPNTTAEQVHLDRLRQLAEQYGSAPAAKGTTQPKETA